MIVVDYACRECGATSEQWLASPPPATVSCHGCGGSASRRWSPIGLSRTTTSGPSARVDRDAAPANTDAAGGRPLCARYPQVPGLCHMSPTAGRVWVARYLQDHRALDAELGRQQSTPRETAPTMNDAVTHHHYPAGRTAVDVA
jgi:CubicO group peptidase (beta-lactamase class C family)